MTQAIESPCIRVCTLDDGDICLGCGRTLEEICEWGGAGMNRRQEIVVSAQRRLRLRQQASED